MRFVVAHRQQYTPQQLTTAVQGLDNVAVLLSPAQVDVLSNNSAYADSAQPTEQAAELLQRNTVDLLVSTVWWARSQASQHDDAETWQLADVCLTVHTCACLSGALRTAVHSWHT